MSQPTDDLSKVLFVRINRQQLAVAKREAKRLGVSVAKLARLALEKYLTTAGG